MKKIVRSFFLLCTLCSATAFAQEVKDLPTQTTTPSHNIFGLGIGVPINAPRCDPYISAVDTSKTCYVFTGDTSLLNNKRVQNIRIYFPRDHQPKESLQQWLNGSLYKNNLVLLEISTAGIAKQALVMDALKMIYGQPIVEKTIEAGSTTAGDSAYLPGSLVAQWSLPKIEVFFGSEYKSSKRGMIQITLKMKAFEMLDTVKSN